MTSVSAQDWLHIKRIVRFGETDAAGVIHFYHLLRWCHESWEESLYSYGIDTVDVFPSFTTRLDAVSIALPIVHCEADFFSPLTVGDKLIVEIIPIQIDLGGFQVKYKFKLGEKNVALGVIRHRAIRADSRTPCELPECIGKWLEASTLNRGVTLL